MSKWGEGRRAPSSDRRALFEDLRRIREEGGFIPLREA